MPTSRLEGVLASIARRVMPRAEADPLALCEALLSGRGEASGVALAREFFKQWANLGPPERREVLIGMAERFGPDRARLEQAIEAWRAKPNPISESALHDAAEPRRQEVLRRLNLAPSGTGALVRMREEVLRHLGGHPCLDALDADFAHLFSSWFNRGFLALRHIDWRTPANILEKVMAYEAVHIIRDWDDLRRRLEPEDRRCFAFFHPQLADEPLIFVEVALTTAIPSGIGALLTEDRESVPAHEATTAVFYSISNCQEGLRGISFGNFLIKQVVEDLRSDLPQLKTFATLSPVPGFAAWAAAERPGLGAERGETLRAAAAYLLTAKTRSGKPLDPVARFHLGNGARLERLNHMGDPSPKGMRQAHGLMVNYLYEVDRIEANHERFAEGEVVAAESVRAFLKGA
ncbi:MAG: malonyl-CoA decarboxylase [Alphaproteobacteria bacterium]|nr:malonyl-CoA decarboxylase [Alphaproteobacteria bacterium]